MSPLKLARLESDQPEAYRLERQALLQTVHSFAELVGTPFADGVNALCWPRALPGDFGEVVEKLSADARFARIAGVFILAFQHERRRHAES